MANNLMKKPNYNSKVHFDKLLDHVREFAVCMENMHGYNIIVSHVPRSVSAISFYVAGP